MQVRWGHSTSICRAPLLTFARRGRRRCLARCVLFLPGIATDAAVRIVQTATNLAAHQVEYEHCDRAELAQQEDRTSTQPTRTAQLTACSDGCCARAAVLTVMQQPKVRAALGPLAANELSEAAEKRAVRGNRQACAVMAEPRLLCLPTLPCDIVRMIWQALWHAKAACKLQRAWHARRMRRAWKRMRGQWIMAYYLWKYVAEGESCAAVIEYQSRSVPHMHVLAFRPGDQ